MSTKSKKQTEDEVKTKAKVEVEKETFEPKNVIDVFKAKVKQDREQRGYCQPGAIDAAFEAAVDQLEKSFK